MQNLKNKINEQTKLKQTQTQRVNWCLSVGRGVKEVKGLRNTNWQLQNSHEDEKYSIGNIGNNIVITMYYDMLVLEIS